MTTRLKNPFILVAILMAVSACKPRVDDTSAILALGDPVKTVELTVNSNSFRFDFEVNSPADAMVTDLNAVNGSFEIQSPMLVFNTANQAYSIASISLNSATAVVNGVSYCLWNASIRGLNHIPCSDSASEPTASDFKVQVRRGEWDPDAGTNGQMRMYISISAAAAAIAQVASVTYDVNNTYPEPITSTDRASYFQVEFSTYANNWTTSGTTINLKSGTAIEMGGTAIPAWSRP